MGRTGCQDAPRVIIPATLQRDGAAKWELLPSVAQRPHRARHHRADNSPQPTRQRERRLQRVKSAGQAQRLLSA